MSTNISLSIIKELTKFRLTLSVVFSSFISYFLGASEVNLIQLFYLIAGGILIVSSSNIFNQIIERDLDKLMKRTQNRPLPKKEITPKLALFLAILSALIGLIFMYLINLKVAILAAVSIFLYTAIYTPMKLISPLSVFVGAIPGAFPFMIGWVAATNDIGIEALTLFLMQFFWQFPHFWSIGWSQNSDYEKAGFKMLPTGRKDKSTSAQILFYSIWAVLVSIVPFFGITGELKLSIVGVLAVFALGAILIYKSYILFLDGKNQNAKKLMLTSVIYLTFIQLTFLFDKIF
ncbi:MAG: protoheme IX farnesyltransferase [Flavobacteriaceae bacterium]|nr:protoheme IX farnesyltransferase [Flavobacteriaceae bacterium]OUV84766.1 MAG: protoheme IX farnesyltransferase [Flavobacteriaceae bacterium TMED145]